MPGPALLELALGNPEETRACQERLREILGDSARIVTDGSATARVRLVPVAQLPAQGGPEVVAIGDVDLPALVSLLSEHRWLDHVVSPRLLQGDSGGLVASVLKRLLSDENDEAVEPTLDGTEAFALVDSAARLPHLEAICARARNAGASPLVVERIRDVAEETITNALYNAPAEATNQATIRSERVQLEPHQACHVSYGVAGKLFILRVRDRFGSFRRERLCQVLERCARQQEVSLDTSRGGAGLGMWRVFNAATVIVIDVRPGIGTEITLALDLTRRSNGGARAVHLFFDSAGDARGTDP